MTDKGILDERIQHVYLLNGCQNYDNLTGWIKRLAVIPLRIVSSNESVQALYELSDSSVIILVADTTNLEIDLNQLIFNYFETNAQIIYESGILISTIDKLRSFNQILSEGVSPSDAYQKLSEATQPRRIPCVAELEGQIRELEMPGGQICRFQVVTVASDPTDGYERFVESCRIRSCPFVVLGMGEPWHWDLTVAPGGGRKVNLLKAYLEDLPADLIILFTDSYDVVILDSVESIMSKFFESGASVLFSAETDIWPDRSLAESFPRDPNRPSNPYVYLNSGGLIASVQNLRILTATPLSDADDDQLYYQHRYLESVRGELSLSIRLDHECRLFQTMTDRFDEIKVDASRSVVQNTLFESSSPSVLHGNGGVRSKMHLNSLANYVPDRYRDLEGYLDLRSDRSILDQKNHILILIRIHKETAHNYANILAQAYPHNLCRFRFYGLEKYADTGLPPGLPYTHCGTDADLKGFLIRAIESVPSDYYFLGDSNHFITDTNLLNKLLAFNHEIIAPVLTKTDMPSFSNFWGDVGQNGYYQRSWDYLSIVDGSRRGVWNVPYVSGSLLIRQKRMIDVLRELKAQKITTTEDFDMHFCRVLRRKYIFLHVTNLETYGYLN